MELSENPYLSPQTSGGRDPGTGVRMIRHVRIVAVLTMCHGAMLCLMGAMLLMFTYFFASMPAGGVPAQTGMMMLAYYLVIGLGVAGVGVGSIYAGYCNFSFRGRILGIVMLSLGMVSVMTCYCAPTSIALAIYGLIVYLNQNVSKAFALGEQGIFPHVIMARFAVPD